MVVVRRRRPPGRRFWHENGARAVLDRMPTIISVIIIIRRRRRRFRQNVTTTTMLSGGRGPGETGGGRGCLLRRPGRSDAHRRASANEPLPSWCHGIFVDQEPVLQVVGIEFVAVAEFVVRGGGLCQPVVVEFAIVADVCRQSGHGDRLVQEPSDVRLQQRTFGSALRLFPVLDANPDAALDDVGEPGFTPAPTVVSAHRRRATGGAACVTYSGQRLVTAAQSIRQRRQNVWAQDDGRTDLAGASRHIEHVWRSSAPPIGATWAAIAVDGRPAARSARAPPPPNRARADPTTRRWRSRGTGSPDDDNDCIQLVRHPIINAMARGCD